MKTALSLVTLVACLSGCTVHHAIRGNLNVPKTTVAAKIPLRVGLYMSPNFRKDTFFAVMTIHEVHLGEGMSRGAEKACRAAFEEVVLLEEEQTDLTKWNLDAVIHPVITERSVRLIGGLTYSCSMNAKWTIIDLDGNILYVNSFPGEHIIKAPTSDIWTKCMTSAVEEHYEKLLSHLLSVNWWEDLKERNRSGSTRQ